MIRIESLTFAYTPGAPIFKAFDWSAERGQAWAVLGPSGCGKSTLLALLAGLRKPKEGRVLIDGQPLDRPRPHTGLIIQDYGLLPWATVQQNVALGLDIRRFYGPDGTHAPKEKLSASDAGAWLERLGLADLRDQYPAQISGGQRQRTAIARTLALQPDLLLMDEPFSSLDAPTREGLQRLVLDLWVSHNLTLVAVTHAIEEAAVLGQKILVLSQAPTTRAQVIDNPGMLQPDYRETADYMALCHELRAQLEEL